MVIEEAQREIAEIMAESQEVLDGSAVAISIEEEVKALRSLN